MSEFRRSRDRKERVIGDARVRHIEVGEVWKSWQKGREDCGGKDGVLVKAEPSNWE